MSYLLLADDNEEMRLMLRDLFRSAGHEVDLVEDGHAVLAAISGREPDLVILDHAMPGGQDFIGAVMESTGANVLVCTSDCSQENVLAAMQAGAIGFLRKDTLTMEGLAAAVQAAASGAGVVTPELLGGLVRSAANGANGHARAHQATLTDREQQVLSLIAAGHPTREVAQQLCYSERTVKNVLHDVVTKLNARSRSQAVAFAVREGLI